jgi:transglutaminase-like putative cysteine protease
VRHIKGGSPAQTNRSRADRLRKQTDRDAAARRSTRCYLLDVVPRDEDFGGAGQPHLLKGQGLPVAPRERRRDAARPGVVLVVVALSAGAVALAQEVILHEMVPGLGVHEGSSLVSSRGAEPAAIVYAGEILRAPEGGPLEADERPMDAAPGSATEHREPGRRSPTFRPDRVTALHGAVPYFEVFTPTVTPYKRVSALDEVRVDATGVPYLAVSEGPRERIEVEGPGARPPDGRARDRFWGSVVLDFSGGDEVPLPSISPESRILSLRTEPATPLHVERDRAGNYVAVLEPGVVAAEVRLVFLTDAPRTYFGFDGDQRWPEAGAAALSERVPALPPRVARDAQTFAAELGLRRGMPFGTAMDILVRHFRSFAESEEPPVDTGNVYLDLARGMRGVCRHRAYAFVITARSLGIDARFVSNEAHAWVEVQLPERRGWLRVDLGGSAQGLSPRNTESGPAYRPSVRDPLPRPPEFERALADAEQRSRQHRGSQSAGGQSAGGQSGESRREAGGGAQRAEDPSVARAAPSSAATSPPAGRPRVPLQLSIEQHTTDVLRGRALEVSGRARSAAGVEAGVRVEVLLRDRHGAERLLGVTVSDANGLFHGSFGVPPDTEVGEHELVVRSPGSAHLEPAVAGEDR